MIKKPSKNQEIVFPDDSHIVTHKILEKYKLGRDPMKMLQEIAQEMQETKTPQEKQKIAEKQPETKLAKTMKKIAEGEISLKNFPKELQEIFNISQKTAKDLSKDLAINVLVFAKKVTTERESAPPMKRPVVKPLPIAPPPEEPEEPLEDPSPPKLKTVPPEVEKPVSPEKKPIPRKEDTYREPFE